jgi:hypothetical protein
MLSGGFALAFLILDLIAAAIFLYCYKEDWPEGAGCAIMVAVPVTINLVLSASIWIVTLFT